jgi:hypothetical protein
VFRETIRLYRVSRSLQGHAASRQATEHMVGPDPTEPVSPAELRSLISDFETLVAAGVIGGTRREASQFFSGWLAFEVGTNGER